MQNTITGAEYLTNLVDCILEALDYDEHLTAHALINELEESAPLTAVYWRARTVAAHRIAASA